MLHISNGESVIGTMRQSAIAGDYLSWADVLHDGPVPLTGTLEELSEIRAEALADFGCGDQAPIRSGFAARDATLRAFREHDEVVLWFEHDLFDQLQLLQILDWFFHHDLGGTSLTLIQIDAFPGVEPFHGLGQLNATQLEQLFPTRKPVTQAQLALAAEAWKAFRSADPTALNGLMRRQQTELPFLAAALRRLGEEYPWTSDGLSRTERQLLRAAQAGARIKLEFYKKSQREESCPWGDLSVYLRVDGLAEGRNPALEKVNSREFALTETGRNLLSGQGDWIHLSGGIDTWIGGVHLAGTKPRWRWDGERQQIVAG